MTDEYVGWHFIAADRRERWGDKRLIEVGQTYTVEPPIKLCERGLHASERAIDALNYAPGPIVCKVRLSGRVVRDTDKAVATVREVMSMADATMILHEFACICAEDALHLIEKRGQKADKRSWVAIETKRRWMKGEATDKELAAARAAARAAAWDAAWAAARDAQGVLLERLFNGLLETVEATA